MKTVREAGETFSSVSGHDSRFAPLGDSLVIFYQKYQLELLAEKARLNASREH